MLDRFPTGWPSCRSGGRTLWGGGKLGYVDRDGVVVIAPRFDAASSFSEGMAAVGINRKWGFIDKTGKLVVAPQFDRAWDFSGGLAQTVVYQVGRRLQLYIDKTGRVIWREH